MTKGPIKNMAASVRQRLLNVAHSTHRRFSDVLQHHALERHFFDRTETTGTKARQAAIAPTDRQLHDPAGFVWTRLRPGFGVRALVQSSVVKLPDTARNSVRKRQLGQHAGVAKTGDVIDATEKSLRLWFELGGLRREASRSSDAVS
jgi:hypothetical protein